MLLGEAAEPVDEAPAELEAGLAEAPLVVPAPALPVVPAGVLAALDAPAALLRRETQDQRCGFGLTRQRTSGKPRLQFLLPRPTC